MDGSKVQEGKKGNFAASTAHCPLFTSELLCVSPFKVATAFKPPQDQGSEKSGSRRSRDIDHRICIIIIIANIFVIFSFFAEECKNAHTLEHWSTLLSLVLPLHFSSSPSPSLAVDSGSSSSSWLASTSSSSCKGKKSSRRLHSLAPSVSFSLCWFADEPQRGIRWVATFGLGASSTRTKKDDVSATRLISARVSGHRVVVMLVMLSSMVWKYSALYNSSSDGGNRPPLIRH